MINIKYQAHVSGEGWQEPVENGQIAGTVGQHKAIEAVRIVSVEGLPEGTNLGVTGKAHVQDIGWGDDSPNGADIGSTGLGKHLEAIILNVFGADADKYEILYRLHVEDKGFLLFSKNGEKNGTEGENLQAEAIQIILHKKGDNLYLGTDTPIAFEKIEKEIEPPQPIEEPVDSKRKRLIDEAASHIGEGGSEFQARMGIPGLEWCDAFVSCVFIDCGLRDLIPITTYVPTSVEWAQANGKWRPVNSGYVPHSGDPVIFDFNGNGIGDHIGIVHSVNSAKDINSCEGNTGTPRLVRMQHRTKGILGYIQLFD